MIGFLLSIINLDVFILANAALDAIDEVIATLDCKNTSCLNPCPTEEMPRNEELQIPTDTCESQFGDKFEVTQDENNNGGSGKVMV